MRDRWLEADGACVEDGVPARGRTEASSFGRSGPQSGGTGTVVCGDSGLPARNRTWATGFVDRCSDSTETGRGVVTRRAPHPGIEPGSDRLEGDCPSLGRVGHGEPRGNQTLARGFADRDPHQRIGSQSGQRESNPHRQFGRLWSYRWTMSANGWNRRDSNSHRLGAGQAFSL